MSLDARLQKVEEKALQQLREMGRNTVLEDRLEEYLIAIAADLEEFLIEDKGFPAKEVEGLGFPHWVLEATRWISENREKVHKAIHREMEVLGRDLGNALMDVLWRGSQDDPWPSHRLDGVPLFRINGAPGLPHEGQGSELLEALKQVKEVSERRRLHRRKS